MRDANGNEINIGDTVRHKHPPLPVDFTEAVAGTEKARGHHMFFGASEVIDLIGRSVVVKPTSRRHISVHCCSLVVKVDA